MKDIRPRWFGRNLEAALKILPVTVVTGARQTGETTLVKTLGPARTYLTLDDVGVWGAYGNTIGKIPNMDHFSRTAMRFARTDVQDIACNPSRPSFRSGLRPLTSGEWGNGQVMRGRLPSGMALMPAIADVRPILVCHLGQKRHPWLAVESVASGFLDLGHFFSARCQIRT